MAKKQIASTITLDATGETLGRLASKIAKLIQGKEKSDFANNQTGNVKIIVNNLSHLMVTGKKQTQKLYYRHTVGYPGHLKSTSLDEMWQANPAKVLYKAVFGMLPENKLRNLRMKNLTINL
ncbi:MAG TPA: 50S ribosomal protein L13 [Candidatus Paceibacterota bacterium]|nr:50S ribosomal protein L13 [Candidatus Paceibacterota bacterium]